MAVTLVNDDLRGFITRWDAVIAGMTSEPDMMWKQAYFHNAIKTFKPLSHDLAVYDRTPEGEPNRSYEFLMKAARDYLKRRRLEKMRQATKKSVSGKRDATPAPTRPPSAGKPTACAMTSRLASALGERIADIDMKSQTKEKAEARKASLGPSQEAVVDLCLQDLGTKCVSFGRQADVSEVATVLSNTHQSLQLHLPKMTSVERARKRRRRRIRRRVIAPDHQVEVPIPRRAHRVSRTKGENHLPLAQLQFA